MIQRITDDIPEVERIFYRDGFRVALFTDGTILPIVSGGMADDGGDGGDGGDGDDGDGGDDDDIDDDEDEDDEDDKKQPTAEQLRIRDLSRENKRHRLQKKALRTENEDLKSQLAAVKDKGADDDGTKVPKEDLDKVQNELNELKTANKISEALADALESANLDPKRRKAIMKVMDWDDVEVDDDGTVSGLTETLEAIAEEYPEWVLKASQGDDDDGNDDDDEGSAPRKRTSGKPNRKRKGSGQYDAEALMKKYPALRR